MGGDRPEPLILTTGHQSHADLFLPWSSNATCPWCFAITPDPDDRHCPGAIATAVQE